MKAKQWTNIVGETKSKYTWELNDAIFNFQKNAHRLRKEKKLSQRGLAKQMGVNHTTVVRHLTWGEGITHLIEQYDGLRMLDMTSTDSWDG